MTSITRQNNNTEYNIAVLTAQKADSTILSTILGKHGFGASICSSLQELCECIAHQADTAIITDETLLGEGTMFLKEQLTSQPDWSYFPLIVMSSSNRHPLYAWKLLHKLDYCGQTQLLERPVHTAELVSAVRLALTSRTHQYQIRDELRHRQEIEHQLNMEAHRKNEFLAVLGHELRNPLVSLKTAVEMLQKKPPAERRKWCEQIVGRQVDQLQRLVNDLIDISRITQGKIELQIETVEITEQMQHAVESIKTSTTQKNQHLWISTPSEPIFIEADPVRLQQIFTNLLKNASMYTPDGGGIWFSAHEEEDAVAVSCRDNGMGIRDDQVESIFKPFIEVNPYYKGSQGEYREGGLGIGLSLVKQLSELHGGAVQVISEGEGKGSEFILRLPKAGTLYKGKPFPTGTGETTPETGAAAPGATQSPSPVADTARPSSSHSILIVEDNQDFAALLRETLSDDGHEVLITDNGQDAIDKTLSEVPDYVIIDIGISDMDGYTIAEKLRESPGLEKTTLIALSGYNPDTSQPEHLFDHYIIKGSDIERLFSIINFP